MGDWCSNFFSKLAWLANNRFRCLSLGISLSACWISLRCNRTIISANEVYWHIPVSTLLCTVTGRCKIMENHRRCPGRTWLLLPGMNENRSHIQIIHAVKRRRKWPVEIPKLHRIWMKRTGSEQSMSGYEVAAEVHCHVNRRSTVCNHYGINHYHCIPTSSQLSILPKSNSIQSSYVGDCFYFDSMQ